MNQQNSSSRSNSSQRSDKKQKASRKKSESLSKSRSRSKSPKREFKDKQAPKRQSKNGNRSTSKSPSKQGGHNNQVRKYKGGYQPNRPKYLIPQLDGPLVQFRKFMEHQPDKVEKEKAEKYYNEYKQNWEQKQNEIFFSEHKDEAWFLEKYDPVYYYQYIQEKNAEASRNAQKFIETLKSSLYSNIQLGMQSTELEKQKADDQAELKLYNEQEKPVHQEVYLQDTIDLTSEPFFGFDQDKNTVFIRNIPKSLSRWELKQHLEKLPGYLSLSISDPQKLTDYLRFGWVYFSDEDSTNKAVNKISQLLLNDTTFNAIKSQTGRKSVKVSQTIDMKKATEVTFDLIKALDLEKQISNQNFLEELQSLNQEIRLDTQLLYLRKVHSFCYLCGVQYNDERMLASKCSIQHLRLKNPEDEEEEEVDMTFPTWQTRIIDIAQKKIQEINEKWENEEKVKAENPDVLIRNLIGDKILKKSANNAIFPCLFCDKKFKGKDFVVKHIETKHEQQFQEEYQKTREKIAEQNYCKDKYKLTSAGIAAKKNPIQNYIGNSKIYKGKIPLNNRRDKKYMYKDLDAPEQNKQEAVNTSTLVNYHDI